MRAVKTQKSSSFKLCMNIYTLPAKPIQFTLSSRFLNQTLVFLTPHMDVARVLLQNFDQVIANHDYHDACRVTIPNFSFQYQQVLDQ